MTDTFPKALNETFDCLLTLWRDNVSPEGAMAHFHTLQERHRNMDMDLLWEQETYPQAVHYDVLLRLPGQGTVSLSFCPDRGVPWPLRRAHYAREGDLVRVNAQILTVERAMACLDFLWNETRIITSLVHVCLIQEAVAKRAIALSDAELQQALDAFRQQHGLYTVADTYRWMEQHGMTHERLEQYIASQALSAKLRDQITDGGVEEYFERHPSDFDTAHLVRFKVVDAESAHRIYKQIRSGVVDFFEAMQRRFLAGQDNTCRDLFAVVRRRQLAPQQAAAIFSAAPGAVVGPLRSGEGYDIVRVLHIERARLDEPTREAIKGILFEAWLAERRQEATIEWFWGKADLSAIVPRNFSAGTKN